MDPLHIEETARGVLDPDENLVWCGAPDPARIAIQAIPMAFFGIPFAGFAAFWMVTASGILASAPRPEGAARLFPLFGAPFLLIGLALLLAPVWTFFGARRTVYGITSRRVFIAGAGSRQARSFAKSDISDVEHVERSDGSGDLYFELRSLRGTRSIEVRTRVGFIGIRDVRHVEETLRELVEAEEAA